MAVGYEKPGGGAGSSAGYRPAHRRGATRRDRPTTPRERRWMAQLVVSGVILVLAVLLKLTAPQAVATVSDRLSSLMGTNTDFVAAFSDVGKAVSGGKVGEALNDAYVAVFGPSDESRSRMERPRRQPQLPMGQPALAQRQCRLCILRTIYPPGCAWSSRCWAFLTRRR